MNFQLLKVETQNVEVCSTCTTLRYNQRRFRSAEVRSLVHRKMYPCLSHPSYELERAISHSDLTKYNH